MKIDPFRLELQDTVRLNLGPLKDSIAIAGVICPVLLRGYKVRDGLRRVLACRELLLDPSVSDEAKLRILTIDTVQEPIVIYPATPEETIEFYKK